MTLDERLDQLFNEASSGLKSRIETSFKELEESIAQDRFNQFLGTQGPDLPVWIPNYTSSNVDAIAYLPTSHTLLVAFRRKYDRPEGSQRVYSYPGIDHELYDDLFSAGSPGGTVWDRLRRSGATYQRIS